MTQIRHADALDTALNTVFAGDAAYANIVHTMLGFLMIAHGLQSCNRNPKKYP